ncbi:MAG TPA: cytochrome c [Chitinophagaceae bacterium]|mgnify:FL=1|jgi:nitric oxide reductase subunit C|nr:cytochrome c [Chitinophagaceae bacterium]
MKKQLIFILLFITYIIYSIIIYTKGTEEKVVVNAADYTSIQKGKTLFQQHNCISCHQLYGLGGYLGPELTTAYSDTNRGENYMRAFLKAGGARMPNFHFTEKEIDNIISYLKYVDATAITYKAKE